MRLFQPSAQNNINHVFFTHRMILSRSQLFYVAEFRPISYLNSSSYHLFIYLLIFYFSLCAVQSMIKYYNAFSEVYVSLDAKT